VVRGIYKTEEGKDIKIAAKESFMMLMNEDRSEFDKEVSGDTNLSNTRH
jgi:hypothetical protein